MSPGRLAIKGWKLGVPALLCVACASDVQTGPTGSTGSTTREAPPNLGAAVAPSLPATAASAGQSGQVAATTSRQPSADPDGSPAADPQPQSGATPGQPASSTFCEVLDVMRRDCQACHGAMLVAGAPMPLVTHADFVRPAVSDPARKVYELVAERTHDEKRPMPPAGVLSQDKLRALDAWLAAGALQPDTECATPDASSAATATEQVPWPPADCEDVYTITAHDLVDTSQPYTIAANSEEHPMIVHDAPWGDDDVQLLATRPITQNPGQIHHWILWDALERTNLTFWAPGAGGDVLPPDTGLYMPKGAGSLALDMHYFNLDNPEPVMDSSGLELCITRTFRPKTAAIYGLRGNATVPAMQRAENQAPCTVTATEEVHFLAITPHMHQLGVHAHLDLQRGDEPARVLYDAPYNFEEQTLKPLPDIEIMNGDVLTTTCTYENNTAREVMWGDSTQDEMCFNWMRY